MLNEITLQTADRDNTPFDIRILGVFLLLRWFCVFHGLLIETLLHFATYGVVLDRNQVIVKKHAVDFMLLLDPAHRECVVNAHEHSYCRYKQAQISFSFHIVTIITTFGLAGDLSEEKLRR